MDDAGAGRRLESRVREAMRKTGIASMDDLAAAAHVNRGTLYAVWRGDQRPTSATVNKLATTLDLSARELWRTYEGGEEPVPYEAALVTALEEVAAAIRDHGRLISSALTAATLRDATPEEVERLVEHQRAAAELVASLDDQASSSSTRPSDIRRVRSE